MTKLNELTEKCFAAYDNYEFHVVSHAINDFCVVELSSFYLDIIKDRLYCEEKDGAKRRSAQTALFLILDTMTKIMAPILAFTCDEIWLAMPHRTGDDERNVLLNEMVQPYTQYALSPEEMTRWDRIAAVRKAAGLTQEQLGELLGSPGRPSASGRADRLHRTPPPSPPCARNSTCRRTMCCWPRATWPPLWIPWWPR